MLRRSKREPGRRYRRAFCNELPTGDCSPVIAVVLRVLICLLLFQLYLPALRASVKEAKISRETILFRGRRRSFYLFVPDALKKDAPAPLLVLFHGSGHDGASLTEPWRRLAAREGVVLLAPDSADSAEWSPQKDPPELIRDLVEFVQHQVLVDPRRFYLFGHSAGAVYALYLSLLESNYFAAVAMHAGALMGNDEGVIQAASRKIPIAIWIGTRDQYFSLDAVRKTRDELRRQDFPVEVIEMQGFDHNYYSHSAEVNDGAWRFLKDHSIQSPPMWNSYSGSPH